MPSGHLAMGGGFETGAEADEAALATGSLGFVEAGGSGLSGEEQLAQTSPTRNQRAAIRSGVIY
jgi:hypothetical protein